MRKRLFFPAAALFFLALWCGTGSAAAQVLTIGNGSTLTVNGGILDVNCLDILVMSGGNLLLESGTIKDKEGLTVTPGGVFLNTGGSILDCGAGNAFFVIPNQAGGAAVILLPKK